MKSPYLISDKTFLSNKEARAYVHWSDGLDAESIADKLDVGESTAWTYKYRINDKIDRATRTISLHYSEDNDWVPLNDPETILDVTFFNQRVRGNDRGASKQHAIDMVNTLLLSERRNMNMQDIADEMGKSEEEVDILLGEARAIAARAKNTMQDLNKL